MSRMMGVLWIAIGVIAGSALWSALRTLQYVIEGRQPDMGPGLFILFSPILALPIVIVAGALHLIMRRYFAYLYWWQWALAGAMYSSVLLGLISPWLLVFPLFVNPIVLRALFNRPS